MTVYRAIDGMLGGVPTCVTCMGCGSCSWQGSIDRSELVQRAIDRSLGPPCTRTSHPLRVGVGPEQGRIVLCVLLSNSTHTLTSRAATSGQCTLIVDGLRSRLLQQAAGWKGDVCYQEVAVRGGPGISVGRMPVMQAWEELAVGRMPSMQAWADAACRYWWRQGGFGLLDGATRQRKKEKVSAAGSW